VSTDSAEIADAARALGAEVPFLRPAWLATDEAAMWPVIRHALAEVDAEGTRFSAALLLDPTSPARLPSDVAGAAALLESRADADGVVAVSQPDFNPIWTAVVERNGWLEQLHPEGADFARRQDVPRVLRITASLYLWRAGYVRAREGDSWLGGRYLAWEVPERRAIHIDTAEDLELAEVLLREGLVHLPWLP